MRGDRHVRFREREGEVLSRYSPGTTEGRGDAGQLVRRSHSWISSRSSARRSRTWTVVPTSSDGSITEHLDQWAQRHHDVGIADNQIRLERFAYGVDDLMQRHGPAEP